MKKKAEQDRWGHPNILKVVQTIKMFTEIWKKNVATRALWDIQFEGWDKGGQRLSEFQMTILEVFRNFEVFDDKYQLKEEDS